MGIAAPLLSRFDVVLTLLDQLNEGWDRKLSRFVRVITWVLIRTNFLSRFILNGYKTDEAGEPKNEPKTEFSQGEDEEKSTELWSIDRLRQYFYYIKTNLRPKLSQSAQELLRTYYQFERASSARNTARTTVRLLEALVRLAQAHARLSFRETATALDAVFAIAAVESSARSQRVVGGMGALHAPFPEDPHAEFEAYSSNLLDRLGINELDFYSDQPI